MDKRYKNTFLTMGEMAEVNNFLTQLSDKDKAGFINFVRLSCITYIQDYPGESLTNEEVCSRCMPIWTTLTDVQKEQFSKNDVLEQIRACQKLLDLMPIEGPMIITKDKLDKKQKTTDETATKKRKKTASTSEKEKSNETEKSEGTPQNPGEPAAKKRKKSTPQSPSSKKEKKVKDPNEPKKPISAYIFFSKDHYQKYLAEHAELKDTPNRNAIIGKALGEMWRNLPAEERAPYEEMGKKSNAEYHQKLKEYREKKALESNPKSDDEVTAIEIEIPESGIEKSPKKSDLAEELGSSATAFLTNEQPTTSKLAGSDSGYGEVPKIPFS